MNFFTRLTTTVYLIYFIFLPISPLLKPPPVLASLSTNPPAGGEVGTIRFLYDGDGVRVAKIEEGKTTLYVGDLEKNLTTDEVTKYYSLGGKRVAVLTTHNSQPTTNYLITDHLGSLRNILAPSEVPPRRDEVGSNLNGSSIVKISYYPYGQIRTQTSSIPSRQYTSQINDNEIGLYFYNARYYNPQTANFLTADSVGTNLNKYAYALRNPLGFNDPSGNDEENTTDPQDDCTSNPFSSSCITLSPIDTYTPIQATQPLTAQPCYSQEECQANQEAFIAQMSLLGLVFGGGAVAEIAAPFMSSLSLVSSGGTVIASEQLAEKVYYHYTSAKGAEGIVRDQLIKAFTQDLWKRPLSFPRVVYMTDITPEKLQVISVGEGLVGKLRLFWTTLESLTIKPGMGAVSAEKTTNYFTIIPKGPQAIERSILSYLLRQRAWVKPGDLPLNDPRFTISGPFRR